MDDIVFFHAFISQCTNILGALTDQHGLSHSQAKRPATDADVIKSRELIYGAKEIGGKTSTEIRLNYDASDDLDGLNKTANDFIKEANFGGKTLNKF